MWNQAKRFYDPRTKCSASELGLCIIGISRVEDILVGHSCRPWVILLMGDSYWVYGFYFAEFGWAQSRVFLLDQSGCLSSLEIQESRVYTCLIVTKELGIY